MSITTISDVELATNLAQAKSATTAGPVLVTDGGKPAFAFLAIEDYYRLTGEKSKSFLEIMDSIPGGDFEWEPPRFSDLARAADFE